MKMDIATRVKQGFKKRYFSEAKYLFTCGGRFEILGNHTDHNHGLCLAATCDLAIYAATNKNDKNIVIINSKSYPLDIVNLEVLKPLEEEKYTSKALIRGVAEYLVSHGYKVGGFISYTESEIFPGAGVSSSAAFELLIGQIFNELYNEGKIDKLLLAKAGQYAENKYFGKASGLLDQIGVGFGNISYIEFENIESPVVETVKFPFEHLHFVIINTGGSHAALSHLYSAIPQEMYNAANKLEGKKYLREITNPDLDKSKLTDIEYSRAIHFFGENERVKFAVNAIKNNDERGFLDAINASRISSTENLKNMMVDNVVEGSPLEACNLFNEVTNGEGAIKINGGGFAGSVIAVVPTHLLDNVIKVMGKKYGKANVKEVFVREKGPSLEK